MFKTAFVVEFAALTLCASVGFAQTPGTYSPITGIHKVVVFPKRDKPLQVGVQFWVYPAQDDTLGPTWTLRFMLVPIAPIPWQKKTQQKLATEARAMSRPPPRF